MPAPGAQTRSAGPPGVSVIGSEATRVRGLHRHDPPPLRRLLVQVTQRTRVRFPISLFPADILKLKISPSKLKKKKKLFVTKMTHTQLAGEGEGCLRTPSGPAP